MVAIWRAVSEDYAPFDVDVTTEEPAAGGLAKGSTTDTSYGISVCIGGSSYDWYGKGAGGTAYVDSFSAGADVPAFVFPAQIGGGSKAQVHLGGCQP
jgi:serralysin